jgi:ElaB/YqjD/DUF883 family membrane-anchored ribosome-binding protein
MVRVHGQQRHVLLLVVVVIMVMMTLFMSVNLALWQGAPSSPSHPKVATTEEGDDMASEAAAHVQDKGHRVEEVYDEAKEAMHEGANQVRSKAGDALHGASQKAQEAWDTASTGAKKAKEQANQYTKSFKDQAAAAQEEATRKTMQGKQHLSTMVYAWSKPIGWFTFIACASAVAYTRYYRRGQRSAAMGIPGKRGVIKPQPEPVK